MMTHKKHWQTGDLCICNFETGTVVEVQDDKVRRVEWSQGSGSIGGPDLMCVTACRRNMRLAQVFGAAWSTVVKKFGRFNTPAIHQYLSRLYYKACIDHTFEATARAQAKGIIGKMESLSRIEFDGVPLL